MAKVYAKQNHLALTKWRGESGLMQEQVQMYPQVCKNVPQNYALSRTQLQSSVSLCARARNATNAVVDNRAPGALSASCAPPPYPAYSSFDHVKITDCIDTINDNTGKTNINALDKIKRLRTRYEMFGSKTDQMEHKTESTQFNH